MVSPADVVDPTKPEKFRVIIGDELLGKSAKEIFTGVRYNHRPSEEAPGTARITHSKPGSSTFDLAYHEPDGTRYGYNGTRAMNDNQYVLVFDPNRRAFVLHKLDSLFNMNLIATPDNDNPAALKRQHPFLSGHGVPSHLEKKAAAIVGAGDDSAKAKPKARPNAALKAAPKKAPAKKKEPAKAAPKKAAAPQQEAMALPQAPSPAISAPSTASPPAEEIKKKKKPSDSDDDDEDDEEDSDDGGLEIVYTDSQEPKSRANQGAAFSPPFPAQPIRRFSEFIKGYSEEDEDADGEPEADDDDDDMPDAVVEEEQPEYAADNSNEPDHDDFGDLEEDLEAALAQELELAAEESDVSEED